MRKRRPRAYLRMEIVGYWMFEVEHTWIARDYWGVEITRAKTRKECEANCRKYGYVPERW